MMAAALIARASTQLVVEDRGRVPEGIFSQFQFFTIIYRIIERMASRSGQSVMCQYKVGAS